MNKERFGDEIVPQSVSAYPVHLSPLPSDQTTDAPLLIQLPRK